MKLRLAGPIKPCRPDKLLSLFAALVLLRTSLQALSLGTAQTWSSMKSGTSNFRVLQTDANRAAGQGGDRPEVCFTSEDDDHEVALSAQKSGMRTSWVHRLFLLR